MELSSPKLKNSFFGENLLGFFIIVSSGVFIFHRWFLPLFFECFHCWLHFFMSPTLLLFCQVLRSCVVPWVLRIWESFFYSQAFLPYTPSQHLAQSAFIMASLGVDSSSLKAAGPPPTEVRNTEPVYLFVWITQCSAKGISR